MYLFFDKNGTLLEVVNDEAKRQYNMNVNRLYVYIQDEDDSITGKINPDIVALQHRYKKSDGTIVDNTTPVQRPIQSGGNPYEDGVFEYKEVPFNRRRDLKHFVYGRKYEFFVVNVPSGIVTEVDYEGDETTTVEYITEGTVFDVAGTVLATLTAVYQEHSDLVLERFAFTIEESVPTTDGALSGSQFSWIIGELIRMKANASKYLDYNEQNNRPIFNQDLDSAEFSPIENTYYRHVGENETNYTRGLIYYWDGNKYSKIDGGTRIELNGEEVEAAKIYAPTKSGNKYQVLLSNGSLAEPVWVNLIVNKNGLEHTIKLGDHVIGTITLPQETYIDSIDYNTATHVVTFEYNGPSGKTDETIDLSDLLNIYTAGNGLQQIGNEFSIKTNSTYLSTSTNGLTVAAQSIADLAEIKLNGSSQVAKSTTFYAPTSAGSSSNILFSNGSGSPSWGSFSVNNGTAKSKSIFAPTSSRSTNSTNSCWVLVPNGSTSAPVWRELTVEKNGLTYTLELGGVEFGKIELTQEIYLDDVTYDKDKNHLIFTYNTASGEAQIEVDLTDLVDMYEAGNGLVRDNGVFSIKIAPDSEKYLKATAEGLVFDESALPKQDTTGLMLLYDGELSADITTVDSTQVTIPSNHEIAVGDVLFSTLETTYGATAKIVSVSDTTLGVDFVGNVSGSSPIAKTEDEMNALLVEENVGKLVSYIGEGGGAAVGTPFAVGDTIDTLYFNTSVEPDLSALTYDDEGLANLFVIGTTEYNVYNLASATGGAINAVAIMTNEGVPFYSTEAFDFNGVSVAQGWQNLTDGAYSLGEMLEVATVNSQDLWSSYISKEPFGAGSKYKKNTLYMVVEEEKEAPEIAVGDTIDTLYFNTSLSDEEMLANLSALTYEGGGAALFGAGVNTDNATDILQAYELSALTEGAMSGYCLVGHAEGNAELAFSIVYSTEAGDVMGMPATKGWSVDNFNYGRMVEVLEVNQQDIWGKFISKEPFTGGGIIAKPVGAEGGDVSIDSVETELVDELSYNDLTDVPILIGDLDAITPVANTYYKHNGADETTYTKGVIYFYDGSTFAPVTGGGGGVSDVQINGTSIVDDGVANIPYASDTKAGLVSTGEQIMKGNKTFWLTLLKLRSLSSSVTSKNHGFVIAPSYRTLYMYPLAAAISKFVLSAYLSSGGTTDYSLVISGNEGMGAQTIASDNGYPLILNNYLIIPYESDITNARTVMATPSTWSTGTSGSVTLPSAGLYEFKFNDGAYNYSGTVNWDGTNRSASQSFVHIGADAPARTMTLSVETTGIMTVIAVPTAGGSKENLTEYTISYRKIGIA